MRPRFKVGDRVRVREGCAEPDVGLAAGDVREVTCTYRIDRVEFVNVEGCGDWSFGPWRFEPVEEPERKASAA